MKVIKVVMCLALGALGIVAAWYVFVVVATGYMWVGKQLFDYTWPVVRWFGVSNATWVTGCLCAPAVLICAGSLFLNMLKKTHTLEGRITRLEDLARDEESAKLLEASRKVEAINEPDRKVA